RNAGRDDRVLHPDPRPDLRGRSREPHGQVAGRRTTSDRGAAGASLAAPRASGCAEAAPSVRKRPPEPPPATAPDPRLESFGRRFEPPTPSSSPAKDTSLSRW